MAKYFLVSLYTLVMWGLHATLLSVYQRYIPHTKTLPFRFVHVFEIALLTSVVFWLYFSHQKGLSLVAVIGTCLATLALLDYFAFRLLASLRGQFDAWHFVAAYTAVVIGMLIARYAAH